MRRYPFFYRLISIFVSISLLAGVFLLSFTRVLADEEVARIPLGPSVTAVLNTHGVLKLEGSGRSDDYTAENAPLAAYADQIRQVVIPEGITALGDCLFYGLYGLTGTLVLPSTLVELGDRVFSGPDMDHAPRFTWIFNDFTSCEEVVTAREEYTVAADAAPAGYSVAEDAQTEKFQVEKRDSQRVGQEVFYPAEGRVGLALCTMENLSFLAAAVEGGYALADGEVALHLIPGDGEGELTTLRALAFEGAVTAPECPEDFAPAAKAGYFAGWLGEDGESMYSPGDAVPLGEDASQLALCALWGGTLNTLAAQVGPAYAPWPGDDLLPPATLADEPQGLPEGYGKAIVFDGWTGSDGVTYDPGDVLPDGVTVQEPRWAWAVVGYVSKIGYTEISGLFGNIVFSGYTLHGAMGKMLSQCASKTDVADKYRNILVVDLADAQIRGDVTTADRDGGNVTLPKLACTATSVDPVTGTDHRATDAKAQLSLDARQGLGDNIGGKYTLLSESIVFHDISLTASHREGEVNVTLDTFYDGLFANCCKVIMGGGITVSGQMNLFGGSGGSSWMPAGSTAGGDLAIFSGTYQRIYGGSFKKEVKQDRSLRFIGGETKLLFGGGYQKDSTTAGNGTVYLLGGKVKEHLVAASDEGVVKGNASLIMAGSSHVGGNIYGGGNIANMTGSTSITILSGSVGGNVYGGGNEATVTGEVVTDTEGKSAYTGGETRVTVRSGTIDGSVYGGGFSATAVVTGSTSVSIEGGTVKGSVYGGGDQAAVLAGVIPGAEGRPSTFVGGTTTVNVQGGTVMGDVFGGSVGKERSGSEAYEEGGAAIDRGTEVTVTGEGAVRGSVYGGGSNGNVGRADTDPSVAFTRVNILGGSVGGSVFGGGLKGKVGLGNISDPKVPQVTDVNPAGSTTVTMTGGSVGEDVFGGGSGVVENLTGTTGLGVVYGDCAVNISGGTVGKRVFGGSNMARITGSSEVRITSDNAPVGVAQSIYAGGNGQGVTFDEELFLVFGTSTVWVEKTAHPLTLGGSIFGSGNLTRVGGRRTLTLKGPDPGEGTGEKWKLDLASLQRAHTITIENCDLTLTGAEDKVDMTSLAFSIARVPEAVKLINSDLRVETELNEVKGLGSYQKGGTEPDMSGRNSFTVLAGQVLRFGATDPATNAFVLGPVKGVTRLYWEKNANLSDPDNQGVFIHADYKESDTAGVTILGGVEKNTGAFVTDQRMPEGQELVAGKVPAALDPGEEPPAGAFSYWRLGGNNVTVRAVLKLTKTEDTKETYNGRSFYKDEVTFQLPTMVLLGTEFTAADVNMSGFAPMLTHPASTAPSTQDWQMLKLSVVNDGTLWGNKPFRTYLTDADGVVHESGDRPVTEASGRPAFTASFYYENPDKIPSGKVIIQLAAHEAGDPDDKSSSRGLFTLELSIEGFGNGTATGQAKAGREYAAFYSPPPTIAGDGAVTAQIVLNYVPKFSAASTEEGRGEVPTLTLHHKREDGTVEVAAVSPTVLMADMFTPTAPRWYSGSLSNGTVKLDALTNVRGMAAWRAPEAEVPVTDKHLLFIVDFRDVGLAPGDYYFMLEFTSGSCVPSSASFRVGDQVNDAALSWSGATLSIRTPSRDVAYGDGALVRLTGLPAGAAREVTAIRDNAEQRLLAGDGAVFLPLPQLTEGSAATVHWDFSAVSESANVVAELYPLPIFQSSGRAAPSAAATLPLTGTGVEQPAVSQRQLLVELKEGDRLVDSATGGVLTFEATAEGGLGEGETVTVTKIVRKTKDAPDDSSYTVQVDAAGYPWSAAFSGGNVTLTLPAGQPNGRLRDGTYRIYFQLTDQSGVPLAQCSYNFIVYSPQ